MKQWIVFLFCCGLLVAQNAYAKQYQKVDHCDYNEETLVETCYGKDGNLLSGWAVEGNQPRSAAAQRRAMRKSERQGKWVMSGRDIYPEGGQTYTLSKFRNGKRNGVSKDIDQESFAVKRVQYKNGVKDGSYEEYYRSNHNRKIRATYKNGLLDGKAIFYSERGQQIGKAEYSNGKLIKGYCRPKKGAKEHYNNEFIKSFPENELINCNSAD